MRLRNQVAMVRFYAGFLGLVAFVTCVARGLIHGGGTELILKVSVVCFFLFGVVGMLIGRIAEWTVNESVRMKLRSGMSGEGNRASVTSGDA